MTNLPTRIGDRYLCFVVVREDRGYDWTGKAKPIALRCEDCGQVVRGTYGWSLKRMADHHECGHAPCPQCGEKLLRRKDGTPRQHAHNHCAGKNPGFKIEREFVRNMSTREFS